MQSNETHPIRRRADGSIDMEFYSARGRAARSQAARGQARRAASFLRRCLGAFARGRDWRRVCSPALRAV